MTRSSLLLCALIAGFAFTPAMAQEKEKPAPKTTVKSIVKKVETGKPDPSKPAPGTPLRKWIDAENALIDPLNDKDKESFYILRNKYSVIRVIRVVERDIDNAVQACSDKNPDIKDKMNDRFKQWKGAVDPIIDTAKKTLEKDLEKQTIVDVSKAREVFKLNDAAYEDGEKNTTKQVVTTPEACQGLIDSMDRTEDQMITLLQQTLLSESAIRQRASELDKAKAEKDKADKEKASKASPAADAEKPADKKPE